MRVMGLLFPLLSRLAQGRRQPGLGAVSALRRLQQPLGLFAAGAHRWARLLICGAAMAQMGADRARLKAF
jgi:hypothetical protein